MWIVRFAPGRLALDSALGLVPTGEQGLDGDTGETGDGDDTGHFDEHEGDGPGREVPMGDRP